MKHTRVQRAQIHAAPITSCANRATTSKMITVAWLELKTTSFLPGFFGIYAWLKKDQSGIWQCFFSQSLGGLFDSQNNAASGYQIGDDCKPACKDLGILGKTENYGEVTYTWEQLSQISCFSKTLWQWIHEKWECRGLRQDENNNYDVTKEGATKGTMKFYQGWWRYHPELLIAFEKGQRKISLARIRALHRMAPPATCHNDAEVVRKLAFTAQT